MEPEGTFASPMISVFSNNLSEGSESCFSGNFKLPDPPKFDETPKEFQAFTPSCESGYDQLALVDQFLRELNNSVMNYLMVTEIPDRLEDCIDAAMLIDLRLSNRDMFLRDRSTYKIHNPFIKGFTQNFYGNNSNPETKTEPPVPM
ncbi:hypothetical protein AYI69_g1329 [Smittium culicis]|uniref:Uncharacterized protein n=1 Tax=Smittium culicis TaxID=133412 RepID=A0A1R1YQN4_9FUNG|nr:hypothetical protein AYI69_g5391 [Smittium culicis]OMJ29170.1 hypothetical protein AYI69_g1329 [Smittium culicis]